LLAAKHQRPHTAPAVRLRRSTAVVRLRNTPPHDTITQTDTARSAPHPDAAHLAGLVGTRLLLLLLATTRPCWARAKAAAMVAVAPSSSGRVGARAAVMQLSVAAKTTLAANGGVDRRTRARHVSATRSTTCAGAVAPYPASLPPCCSCRCGAAQLRRHWLGDCTHSTRRCLLPARPRLCYCTLSRCWGALLMIGLPGCHGAAPTGSCGQRPQLQDF
jgi:hypothetical protein